MKKTWFDITPTIVIIACTSDFQLHILEVVVLLVLDVVLEVACAIPMQSLCSFQGFQAHLAICVTHISMELWNLRYETHSDIGIPIQHLQKKMFNFS